MSLKDTIIADLTAAMKAKDAGKLSTLRMVKANLMNRQIEKGGELTDEEIQKALQTLVKQRRDSVEQYEKAVGIHRPPLTWPYHTTSHRTHLARPRHAALHVPNVAGPNKVPVCRSASARYAKKVADVKWTAAS